MTIDKSFYHGQQGECFRLIDKHFEEIKHEFNSQSNKTFLDPEEVDSVFNQGGTNITVPVIIPQIIL